MPLITDKIKSNAEKCKECPVLKIRNKDLDHRGVFFDEAITTVTRMCNMCPFMSDFEKVYGMKPYEYFPMTNIPSDLKKKKDNVKQKSKV